MLNTTDLFVVQPCLKALADLLKRQSNVDSFCSVKISGGLGLKRAMDCPDNSLFAR